MLRPGSWQFWVIFGILVPIIFVIIKYFTSGFD
jgi:hypothetical protein